MDILNLTPITSLFILILIEKDDGQKKRKHPIKYTL